MCGPYDGAGGVTGGTAGDRGRSPLQGRGIGGNGAAAIVGRDALGTPWRNDNITTATGGRLPPLRWRGIYTRATGDGRPYDGGYNGRRATGGGRPYRDGYNIRGRPGAVAPTGTGLIYAGDQGRSPLQGRGMTCRPLRRTSPYIIEWVYGFVVDSNFKVDVRAGRAAGVADAGDEVALFDGVPCFDQIPAVMAVEGG